MPLRLRSSFASKACAVIGSTERGAPSAQMLWQVSCCAARAGHPRALPQGRSSQACQSSAARCPRAAFLQPAPRRAGAAGDPGFPVLPYSKHPTSPAFHGLVPTASLHLQPCPASFLPPSLSLSLSCLGYQACMTSQRVGPGVSLGLCRPHTTASSKCRRTCWCRRRTLRLLHLPGACSPASF